MRKQAILITGANGEIGHGLIEVLHKQNRNNIISNLCDRLDKNTLMKSNLISKSETSALLKTVSERWEIECPKLKNLKVHQIRLTTNSFNKTRQTEVIFVKQMEVDRDSLNEYQLDQQNPFNKSQNQTIRLTISTFVKQFSIVRLTRNQTERIFVKQISIRLTKFK